MSLYVFVIWLTLSPDNTTNKIACQSKVGPPNVNIKLHWPFYSCDLDPMTLIYEPDLDRNF